MCTPAGLIQSISNIRGWAAEDATVQIPILERCARRFAYVAEFFFLPQLHDTVLLACAERHETAEKEIGREKKAEALATMF